jgi:hypothetical protein
LRWFRWKRSKTNTFCENASYQRSKGYIPVDLSTARPKAGRSAQDDSRKNFL